jgi:long-chain alkane monooxygenase
MRSTMMFNMFFMNPPGPVAGHSRIRQSMIASMPHANPTVEHLARHNGKYGQVVGPFEQIADHIGDYRAVGVNVMSMLIPGTYDDIAEQVAPELQRRGIMQREYAPGKLREKMFPGAGPTLPDSHPARAYREASTMRGAS